MSGARLWNIGDMTIGFLRLLLPRDNVPRSPQFPRTAPPQATTACSFPKYSRRRQPPFRPA